MAESIGIEVISSPTNPLKTEKKETDQQGEHDSSAMKMEKKGTLPDGEIKDDSLLKECEKWKQKVLERVKEYKIRNKSVPNILVVGSPGVGKSSFINSIAAAISGEWHEHAYSGRNENNDAPVSMYLKKYKKLCLDEEAAFKEVILPNILDLSGFDQGDDVVEEVIRSLCYGYIPEGENITEVRALGVGSKGVKAIQDGYSWMEGNLKVNRVVVLCSANEAIPMKLMECIHKAARSEGNYRQGVPIHGVMTKYDTLKKDEQEVLKTRKEQFINALSMKGAEHRFAFCNNYCEDTAPERTEHNYPELDLKILKFLYNLLDTRAKVENPLDNPRGHSISPKDAAMAGVALLVLVIAFLIAVIIGLANNK